MIKGFIQSGSAANETLASIELEKVGALAIELKRLARELPSYTCHLSIEVSSHVSAVFLMMSYHPLLATDELVLKYLKIAAEAMVAAGCNYSSARVHTLIALNEQSQITVDREPVDIAIDDSHDGIFA